MWHHACIAYCNVVETTSFKHALLVFMPCFGQSHSASSACCLDSGRLKPAWTRLDSSMIAHCVQDAYECLQTSLNFDATFTAALPSTSSAVQPHWGAFTAHGTTSYCQQPVCQIYSVDMAFCGQEGLVTDQPQALLVMVCTQEVQVCLDCFTVSCFL